MLRQGAEKVSKGLTATAVNRLAILCDSFETMHTDKSRAFVVRGEPPEIDFWHAYKVQFARVQLSRVLLGHNTRGSAKDMLCESKYSPPAPCGSPRLVLGGRGVLLSEASALGH